MFLRSLKNEQKPLFLGLAYQAVNANGVVEDTERKLIKGFSEELGIPENDYSEQGFDDICDKLADICNRKELIEISFEILGVMMGDTCYDQDEKDFMRRMTAKFSISEETLNEMEKCLDEYLAIYKKIECITNS